MEELKVSDTVKQSIHNSRVVCQGDWIIDKDHDVSIECYVTEDKRRFLSLKGAARALGLKGAGSTALVRNLDRQWINRYLSEGLKDWLREISSDDINETITGPKGQKIVPLEASLFVDICKAYVNAQRDGLFNDKSGMIIAKWGKQNDIADKLFMIMTAFAKVGIIAFIDEITGYQEQRDRNELEQFLAIYLREERLAWAKTFPDEFYKEIYRLKRWPYPGGNKRPSIIGKITNRIVYEKLPDGVLDKLKKLNPVIETTKRRRWKHHQFFSVEIGQPDLKNHVMQLMALQRAAPNWTVFERMVERAFPGPGPKQMEMDEIINV